MGSCRPIVSILAGLCLSGALVAQDEKAEEQTPLVLRVPFPDGETQMVFRGPGVSSHADRFNRYAVDFSPIDEGHLITAALAGEVVFVKEDTEGPTGDVRDNNEVAVRVAGSSQVVTYAHPQKDGALVEVGDFVLPGDPIGRAGNTGSSESTHLHIDVRAGHRLGPSVPWRFATFRESREPKVGDAIRSENRALRELLGPWVAFERKVGLAKSLGRPELATKQLKTLRDLLAAKRPPGEYRILTTRPDVRSLLEGIAVRVEMEFAVMRTSLGSELESSQSKADGLVLALRLTELGAVGDEEDPLLQRAKARIDAAERKTLAAAKRTHRQRGKSFGALEKALRSEVRIDAQSVRSAASDKLRTQVRALFDKAIKVLDASDRPAVEQYRDRSP